MRIVICPLFCLPLFSAWVCDNVFRILIMYRWYPKGLGTIHILPERLKMSPHSRFDVLQMTLVSLLFRWRPSSHSHLCSNRWSFDLVQINKIENSIKIVYHPLGPSTDSSLFHTKRLLPLWSFTIVSQNMKVLCEWFLVYLRFLMIGGGLKLS